MRKALRAEQEGVPFKITRIEVRNVGALDSLDLDFVSQPVTALYAGNGLGKTTVLECLSLLGHLPCFPTFNRQHGYRRSLLESEWPYQDCDTFEHYRGVFDPERARTLGPLSHLAEDPPQRDATYGYVVFEVEDQLNQVTTFNRFAVIVHSPLMQKLGTPRLTDLLSRDSFLSCGTDGLPSAEDDRVLGRCGLVVYDPELQRGRSLDDLICSIANGRTFTVVEGVSPTIRRLRRENVITATARSISYVNTDLNDFGRGNDLRESPKDLERDFRAQMIERLEIELDTTGSFAHFERLKRACDLVLSTPLENFADRRVIPPAFDLKNLQVTSDRIGIWIDRLDGQQAVSINFLSAGENEVLFIYLMLLNFTLNPVKGAAIILLDEPDLHIANISRYRFFEEVIAITMSRAQLIMSTHSPAAYEVLKSTYEVAEAKTKVLLRILPDVDAGKTKLIAEFDGIYLGRLRRLNFTPGIRGRITHFVNFASAQIRSVVPVPDHAASAATIAWLISLAFVVVLLIGAVSNDVLNTEDVHWAWRRLLFFGLSPIRYHEETFQYWVTFLPAAIVPPVSLFLMRAYSRRRHLKRLETFRRSRPRGAAG